MQRHLILLLLSALLTAAVQAKETQYISDDIFVVLHRGPGQDFRWVARLTPGTRLTVARYSEDGEWAEVTTARGTDGWVRKEYLTSEVPAQLQLPQARQKAEQLQTQNTSLSQEVETLKAEKLELMNQVQSTDSELATVAEELTQLKQISGKAVQLDTDNRRLVEEAENLRSEVEMLKAENQRLQDKLDSEDFLNGALAVLMGVIITLVVPRLWPKRRRSSSWA